MFHTATREYGATERGCTASGDRGIEDSAIEDPVIEDPVIEDSAWQFVHSAWLLPSEYLSLRLTAKCSRALTPFRAELREGTDPPIFIALSVLFTDGFEEPSPALLTV